MAPADNREVASGGLHHQVVHGSTRGRPTPVVIDSLARSPDPPLDLFTPVSLQRWTEEGDVSSTPVALVVIDARAPQDQPPRLSRKSGGVFGRPPDVLARFRPTLVVIGTREMMLSSAGYLHSKLVAAEADAELFVRKGGRHVFL